MNYKGSKVLLEKVKTAKKILLNCHRSPDTDSIGCSLALYQVLEGMGKEADIICPSEVIDRKVDYLKYFNKIQKTVDFSTFDFSKYNLFITLKQFKWNCGPNKISQLVKRHILNNLTPKFHR